MVSDIYKLPGPLAQALCKILNVSFIFPALHWHGESQDSCMRGSKCRGSV